MKFNRQHSSLVKDTELAMVRPKDDHIMFDKNSW